VGNLDRYIFNDQSDFDVTIVPGVFWDNLNTWNEDANEGRAKFEKNHEKKYILMTQADEEAQNNLVVKIRFYTPNEI